MIKKPIPRIDIIGQNGNDGEHYMETRLMTKDDYLDKQVKEQHHVVHRPSHYMTFPDMEAIDILKKVLTAEEFMGYCKGNILKYRLRAGKKDAVDQDIAKADTYEEFLNNAYNEAIPF